MSVKQSCPVVLVSGFLGSGKTTFLNRIFECFPERRFGVIVNDFGSIPVDRELIGYQEPGLVRELNNGQIFCSCLASSFIKSVASYNELDIDMLIVETSGLAKPSPLKEILGEIEKAADGRFFYAGMITIVDAHDYPVLSGAVNAVNEQIEYSSAVLLNKADRVSGEAFEAVRRAVRSINPEAVIMRSEYGRGAEELLDSLAPAQPVRPAIPAYRGWGDHGRPAVFGLVPGEGTDSAALKAALKDCISQLYRVKGSVRLSDGLFRVDATSSSISVEKAESCGNPGLNVICRPDMEQQLQRQMIEALKGSLM